MFPVLAAALLVAPPADFASDVRPVFAARCASCHGPAKQRGGLRLDRKAAALTGGESGPAILPGKASASPLVQRVTATDPAERMPPDGDPLTPTEVAKLRAWIDAGAHWPEEAAGPEEQHWAFRPVRRPPVPEISDPKPETRNPIDAFVRARLAKEGLAPAPEADRRTLIRRLKFDLLGLPPTPDEIDAFLKDPSADAYEKLVEHYLASPHFGERWARHWLDVVRFAESHGFETNLARPTAWPYRDYVIRSFNADVPYDRFVAEQLAGDVLGADAATGFLVAGAADQVKSPDPVLTAQQRADELHDIVGTTGATFLGLTAGCARCHDHKFDPVSMADYYGLTAVFAGVQHGERPLRRPDDRARAERAAAARADLARVTEELAALEPLADPTAREPRRLPVNPRVNVERFRPTAAKFVRFTILGANLHEPCIDELEVYTAGGKPRNVARGARPTASSVHFPGSDIHRLEFVNDGRYGNGRSWIPKEAAGGWVQLEFPEAAVIDRVVWGRDREGKYADRLAVRYLVEVAAEPDRWQLVASSHDRLPSGPAAPAVPPAVTGADRAAWARLAAERADLERRLADLERQSVAYIGRFVPAAPTYRLHRGDVTQKREAVAPAALAAFGPKLELPADAPESRRRLALAKWLTDPANPLTARVIVNRLWHYHFGTGIVATPSDFGRNGARPSHPELLDWLASELVKPSKPTDDRPWALPWSLKHIHRLIVTSATYRQSSAATPAGRAKDAQARLLWRYPPRRLEAEPIRDAILAVSGKLNPQMYGPGFDLFEPNANYVKVYTPKTTFGPAEWRRMVYQSRPRMQPDDTFGAFDCPDGGQIAPRRTASTTPLQALNLLNSRFVAEQAGFFAERVKKEAGADIPAQVRRAFRLAFGRDPSDGEAAAAAELVREHGLAALGRALFNANEFVFVE